MEKMTFFSVLKSNLQCAFCDVKDCEVKYYPERKKVDIHGGIRHISFCEKDENRKKQKRTFY